jgi:hypothetical protein
MCVLNSCNEYISNVSSWEGAQEVWSKPLPEVKILYFLTAANITQTFHLYKVQFQEVSERRYPHDLISWHQVLMMEIQ